MRGFGRGLIVLLAAAKYCAPENAALFQSWVKEALSDMNAALQAQTGIHIVQQGGPLVANVNAYPNGGYAPWMQDILDIGIGMAMRYGYTEAQPIIDYLAVSKFQRVLSQYHEFATGYNSIAANADGTPVADWDAGLVRAATFSPKLAAAMAEPEDSLARQTAYGNTSGYIGGDFQGYPTSATGYPAIFKSGLAMYVRYATDQVTAQAAWAKFMKYYRADHSRDGKYNEMPQ